MTVNEVREILNAEVLACAEGLDREVLCACGADLMSDVLAFAKEKGLLLTGLINPQVVRTAEMMDIKAVAFVRGKAPSPEVVKLAEEKDMVILTTDYPMYLACGMLYKNGLGSSVKISDKG